MTNRPIYNLQFPSWCPELNIFDYKFIRVLDYEVQLQRLQHLGSFRSEFNIKANTGEHAVTSFANLPEHEQDAVLEWSGTGNTALMDVLLLLSLFTGRDVFAGEPINEGYESDSEGVILRDARKFQFGGSLRVSIPYKAKSIDKDLSYDIGFEEELNRIYLLVRSDEWQKKFGGGYFLFLARQAFHFQALESSFIQCWTIWEHLFALHNQNWLSNKQIRELSSYEKIAFILVQYVLKEKIDEKSRNRIRELAMIRNRLVHFGRFPENNKVHDDAILFIRLTEIILVKILDLLPSNVFNTIERLEDFLQPSQK